MGRSGAATASSVKTYYLGAPERAWLALAHVPLVVSYHRMARRHRPVTAAVSWVLDSGGFTELTLHGAWTIEPARYAAAAERWHCDVGRMEWAACQDWMCEPSILARTGLSVREHQQRTVDSYIELRRLAPGVPWAPVLQGQTCADYLRHAALYALNGIALAAAPALGVGSVCRRQGTSETKGIVRELATATPGARLHGFGVKLAGLAELARYLYSADSMAWSARARRAPGALCDHPTHRRCVSCLSWAERWYTQALAAAAAPLPPRERRHDHQDGERCMVGKLSPI